MTWDKLILSASSGTILAIIVIAFIQGWIVSGPQAKCEADRLYNMYLDACARADRYEQHMVESFEIAKECVNVTGDLVDKATKEPTK